MEVVVSLIMGSAACFLTFVAFAFLLAVATGVASSLAGAGAGKHRRRRQRSRDEHDRHMEEVRKYLEGPYGAHVEF